MAAVHSSDAGGDEEFPHPFGAYVLLQNFARGGMGEVYLAKLGGLAGLERYCVLKKLRAELTRDREYVTRFIDEARVVVTLSHANICHVFDVGRVMDEYYLAMEYVAGRDARTLLERAIKRAKPIPSACALQLVCETLEALDYAHRRNHPISGEALNLVHRDVSPQNVLVSFEGEVKLIDFGLAASKLKVERTQPNVVMGKMAYMAPEQARGDPIDLRADLFACGVLCYELLTTSRYYDGMTPNDIWNVAGRGGFEPGKWRTLDADVARILAKALHPEPAKRYDTCGEFREALANHLHWRFPGSGVKDLRTVMADLFADEMKAERELFAHFGAVSVENFAHDIESTRSHSVSIAGASSDHSRATTLVRNELEPSQGTGPSGAALMPPPRLHGAAVRDVHAEPTRVSSVPEQTPSRAGQTPPTLTVPGELRRAVEQHEHTQRVLRAPRGGHALNDDEVTAQARSRARPLLVAAAVALAISALTTLLWPRLQAPPAMSPPAMSPLTAVLAPTAPIATAPAPIAITPDETAPKASVPTVTATVPTATVPAATMPASTAPLAQALAAPTTRRANVARAFAVKDKHEPIAELPAAPPPVVQVAPTREQRIKRAQALAVKLRPTCAAAWVGWATFQRNTADAASLERIERTLASYERGCNATAP